MSSQIRVVSCTIYRRFPYITFAKPNNAKNVSPENATEAKDRVVRGGGWNNDPGFWRAARRHGASKDGRGYKIDIGFRVVVASGSGVD